MSACVHRPSLSSATLEVQQRAALMHTQIFARVPRSLPQAAGEALEKNIELIIEEHQRTSDAERNVADGSTNSMVADVLLRSEVEEGQVVETLHSCNPGSFGHPELCSRPCLYFKAGECSNGMECCFCHASHPTRAVHLDKYNRQTLQKMDLADRFVLMAPVLRSKLQLTEFGWRLIEDLDRVCKLVPNKPALPERVKCRHKRDTRSLLCALQGMSARSLLTQLRNTPMCRDSGSHRAIEGFLETVGRQHKNISLQDANDSQGATDRT